MGSWIGFDADDTLWHSEHHFMASHELFCDVLAPFVADTIDPREMLNARLIEVERRNIASFGYGIKAATLSMIEAALEISEHRIGAAEIHRLLDRAKEMMVHPVDLFDGVEDTLDALARHRLALITKGDLIDQRRKIDESELATRFDAVEIIHEKSVETYAALFERLDIDASDFIMVGDSMRSDILPILDLGGWAIHVPFAHTWAHEHAEAPVGHPRFRTVATLRGVTDVVESIRLL